jgi:hypothetical protein
MSGLTHYTHACTCPTQELHESLDEPIANIFVFTVTGDKRHSQKLTEALIYAGNLDKMQETQPAPHKQRKESKKKHKKSDDNASVYSYSSTVSLIKSKFSRSRDSKSRDADLKQQLRGQVRISI